MSQASVRESGTLNEYGPGSYTPGVCNIGAREIEMRRRFGIVSLLAAVVLAILLVAGGAPVAARWTLVLPVGAGIVGLLQARRRFCVQFALRGISDPGDEGDVHHVDDPAARAADRRAARTIVLHSLAIALVVTAAFVILPV